jgi:hypothetical protein
MTKYKTCSLITIHGLLKAEKLKASGWEIESVGLFSIQFYKKGKEK